MTQPQPAPSQHLTEPCNPPVIIDPDQWTGRTHPAIIDPTMTERKRCLEIIGKIVADNKSILKYHGSTRTQEIVTYCIEKLALIRQRIESGEQP